ncbi:hypothetical protein GUJ93_ZPchr0009g2282 [Zizania palustris]|uniref:Uncharacterized protein n=1 Tax=Zizania palustris TaxID=103762 RepID=A0A8J5UXM9_ZIZPA|nr:hypothetical protein GUJ93_ZPchr0009g2282 [Zizania palustris]
MKAIYAATPRRLAGSRKEGKYLGWNGMDSGRSRARLWVGGRGMQRRGWASRAERRRMGSRGSRGSDLPRLGKVKASKRQGRRGGGLATRPRAGSASLPT